MWLFLHGHTQEPTAPCGPASFSWGTEKGAVSAPGCQEPPRHVEQRLPSDQSVLHGHGQSVAHVQSPGHVGGGQTQGEGLVHGVSQALLMEA